MTVSLRTACPLDCPDSCSLSVEVEQGRVTRIEGAEGNPFTQGFICSKVRRYTGHLYGEHRLLYPARRAGAKGSGAFERLGWDQALDLLCERLQEVKRRSGGEAILPLSYGGSNGPLTQDTLDARLFFRLGASRLARTVCAAPSGRAAAGLYGAMPGVAPLDYEHAELIVIWGANPSVSGIHLVPVVQRAQERGGRLIVVDPRRTPLAKRADLHLQPRPGTDLPIALSLIRHLFESGAADRTFLARHCQGADELERRAAPWSFERAAQAAGVAAGDLETFGGLYARSRPAVIRCGWGLERNRNGGSAVAAVLALPAVANKFGVRAGGFTMSNSRAFRLRSAIGELPPPTREINMNRLGEALEEAEPSIDLLFVYNANPLATLPNQERVRRALCREDLFVVVFDQVLTDTARYADLVLPATTFFEHRDLARGYGAMVLHPVEPVAPPPGEARSNLEVFGELCDRLGLHRPDEPRTAAELQRALLGEELDGQLARDGRAEPPAGARPIQFVDVSPGTSDGRVQLVPAALDREAPAGLYHFQPDPGTERYPLALISPASSRRISSTLGQLDRSLACLEMHPDDARARGLADAGSHTGSQVLVRVFNDLGEVRCGLRINPDLRPGVALLPKGLWSHNTPSGTTANALAPDSLSDLGGGACFNDARVEVAPG